MLSSTSTYGIRSNGKEHGVVYTNPRVIDLMLDIADYKSVNDLHSLRVLDPAVGDGAFLFQILERLYASCNLWNNSFEDSLRNIKAVEIDEIVAEALIEKITDYLAKKEIGQAKYFAKQIVVVGDFLTSLVGFFEKYDLVIGNPPYIRHEQIPRQQKQSYRKQFHTFRHRSDIYIGFFEKGLSILSEKGSLCLICSNRWMKAKYGEALRTHIARNYGLKTVIDIENNQAFAEKVDAYASIILISFDKTENYNHLIAETLAEDILTTYEKAKLPVPTSANWFSHAFLDKTTDMLSIEEQGFKIGIGVATGADKIFIGKDLPIENDRLVPVALSKDIAGGSLHWSGNYMLNPYHENTSDLIDLEQYPLMKAYLDKHKDIVEARHTAKQNPAKWYKTIDRIYTPLITTPKLLIPDMKKDRLLPLDEGKYYPHHNLYYITGPDLESLKVLGALLSTIYVAKQVESVSVIMRGGYPRWQSQNLRKIRLPIIKSMPESQKDNLSRAFDSKDVGIADSILNQLVVQIV